jgi:LuxR family transcriptional regulator, maltose regulon positive regulatory protein
MGKLTSKKEKLPNNVQEPAYTHPQITPPQSQRILSRPRLIDQLYSNQGKKLILILGQAAQGKTTLAVSYLAQNHRTYTWINLRAEDSDPVTLFYDLIQALQTTFKETDFSPLLKLPAQTMSPRPENLLFRDWIRSALQSIPSPLLIVLDGLDRLAPQAQSWAFLQVLTEEATYGLQIILLSREMPPLNIQRLKMNQEAEILTNDELAFTLVEVEAFFKENMGIPLSSDQLKTIHQYTQGWAGGLRILYELLRLHPDLLNHRDGLNRTLTNLSDRAFDYFTEELFSTQPREMQELLIKSSIFEVIEPKIFQEIFPEASAEEVLSDLVKRNLFVTSNFNEEKGRQYLYHQMFRDFLQEKFKARLTKTEQQALYNRTASAMEKAGDPEKALHFYLQARDFLKACSIIKIIWYDLLTKGKMEVLARYIEALPKTLHQEDPWILFCLCLTRHWTEPLENIVRLKQCLNIFEEQNELRGILLSLAYLIEALMLQGGSWKELSHFLDKGEKFLTFSGAEGMNYEKASLWFQIGLSYSIRGNPRQGFRASQHAIFFAKKTGDLMLQGKALIHSMTVMTFVGEYAMTIELAGKMEALLEKTQVPDLFFSNFISIATLDIYCGEEEKSASSIQKALIEVEQHGLHSWYPIALLHQVMQSVFFNHYTKSEQLGNYLLNLSETLGINFVKAVVTLFLGVNFFRQDQLTQAEAWLCKAVTLLSADESRTEYHLHYAMALHSLICLKLSKFPTRKGELPEALQYFKEIQAHLFMAESLLVSALSAIREDRKEKVKENLEAGFRIIREKGYDHFLILGPKDIAKICSLALEYEVPGAEDLIITQLSGRYGTYLKPELESLTSRPKIKNRERVHEVRKGIHRSQAPVLHIETLGSFRVFRGDRPMKEEEWERNSAKKFLKVVLSYGSLKIPKDYLMETLWPDSSPSTVEGNFKISLHRLRKSLEPELDETIGSSYVHLRNNLVFLNEALCGIDVQRFDALIGQAKEQEKKGIIKSALSCYQEAEQLYKGDFLAEDPYESWIEPKREELRRKYLSALLNEGRLFESRGSFRSAESCYRKIIDTDPFGEEAYQKLILLYGNQGKRNEVIKVYEQCRLSLESGLNVSPDNLTTAVYKKVMHIP